MEHTDEDLLQDALRMRLTTYNYYLFYRLIASAVGQSLGNSILSRRLLRKIIHPTTVPSNLRTESKSKHGAICCHTPVHLELLHHVPDRLRLRYFPVYPTRENMESVDDNWPLLQQQRRVFVYGNFQRCVRLRHSDPSYAFSLETSNAHEEEDPDDYDLCNWFPVSSHEHHYTVHKDSSIYLAPARYSMLIIFHYQRLYNIHPTHILHLANRPIPRHQLQHDQDGLLDLCRDRHRHHRQLPTRDPQILPALWP